MYLNTRVAKVFMLGTMTFAGLGLLGSTQIDDMSCK